MYNFATNYASVTNFAVPDPSSISFWLIVRAWNVTANSLIGTATDWRGRINVSDKLVEGCFNQTGGGQSSSSPSIGDRIHIVFTNLRSTTGKVYYNGTEEDDNSGSGTPTTPNTLLIGCRNGSTEPANGDMEDVRIYDRILSPNEIKTLYYCNGTDNIYQGLLNRWGNESLGNGQDMDGGTIYDVAARKDGSISGTGAFYRGGYLTGRRRV